MGMRGLEANRAQEIPIKVEPIFVDHNNRPAADKQGFNRQFVMTCSAPWVSHPTHLDLMYCARHFLVHVDPTGLTPGAHSAYIHAYDTTAPETGKVWEIAITVIKTEKLQTSPRMHVSHSNVFQPGTIKRHFLPVPTNATWATFTATNRTKEAQGNVVEVCLAKWWANIGTMEAEYSVTFHGVLPNPSALVMHGGEGLYRVELNVGDHQEEAVPE